MTNLKRKCIVFKISIMLHLPGHAMFPLQSREMIFVISQTYEDFDMILHVYVVSWRFPSPHLTEHSPISVVVNVEYPKIALIIKF